MTSADEATNNNIRGKAAMVYRKTLCVSVAFFLSVGAFDISGVMAAEIFKPDRSRFFQKCSSTTNFEMLGSGDAVGRGKIRMNLASRGAVEGLFDSWATWGDSNPRELAYILATVRRESEGSWKPIREAPSCGSDEGCRERSVGLMLAQRAGPGKRAKPNYALPALNGKRYYGRGYLQLTGQDNYERTDVLLNTGHRLRDNPDEVMEIATAQEIVVRGMVLGWYGDHKPLSHWLDKPEVSIEDWKSARGNVNPGSPHKPIVAKSAIELLGCLE